MDSKTKITLPYPVGTSLYKPSGYRGVIKLSINYWKYGYNNKKELVLRFGTWGNEYTLDAIGTEFFLTKEEAEDVLEKERKE